MMNFCLFILASSLLASARCIRNHAVDNVNSGILLNAVVIGNQKIKSLHISPLPPTTYDKLNKFHSFDPINVPTPPPTQRQNYFTLNEPLNDESLHSVTSPVTFPTAFSVPSRLQ